METLGISPNLTFLQIEKLSYEVKPAIAEKSPVRDEVLETDKPEVHQVNKISRPKIK